jgi:MoxR-like ATPase
MLKVVVDYPSYTDELSVIQRSLGDAAALQRVVSVDQLHALQAATRAVYVDPHVSAYAASLVLVTRRPEEHGLGELRRLIAYGASPRGSIYLVHAARALALLRGRAYVLPQDVRDLAKDVLRHRLVLSYEALADEVAADAIVDSVVEAAPMPQIELAREAA